MGRSSMEDGFESIEKVSLCAAIQRYFLWLITGRCWGDRDYVISLQMAWKWKCEASTRYDDEKHARQLMDSKTIRSFIYASLTRFPCWYSQFTHELMRARSWRVKHSKRANKTAVQKLSFQSVWGFCWWSWIMEMRHNSSAREKTSLIS